MPGSDDPERPSSSPQPAALHDKPEPDIDLQTVTPLTSPSFANHVLSFSMPDPERLQYSNKESCKVNAGIFYGGKDDSGREANDTVDSTNLFSTNLPAVGIDFSQIIIPIVAPEPKPSSAVLVHRLLKPPPHAFVHGILSIQWVIGVVGQQHIKFRDSDERYVLAVDSDLRKQGFSLGIPALYMEWLCGDDEETSATEQGLHLTVAFFQDINYEEEWNKH
jgi:hypothetical protein